MNTETIYYYYLCREVPDSWVKIVCKEALPLGSWHEWTKLGQRWNVFRIMKHTAATNDVEYWINDWIYRMKSNKKLFYLHKVDKCNYDLMDAFGIPHTNAEEYTYTRGWTLRYATGTEARRENSL